MALEKRGRTDRECFFRKQVDGGESRPISIAETYRQVDVGGIEVFIRGGRDHPQLPIVEELGEFPKSRHQPILRKVVTAGDGECAIDVPLFERGQHVAHVTQARADRIGQPLTGRRQFEPVAVANEQDESRLAFDRRHVAAHGGGGNAQLSAGRGQIAMPRGRLENDQRIHGGRDRRRVTISKLYGIHRISLV